MSSFDDPFGRLEYGARLLSVFALMAVYFLLNLATIPLPYAAEARPALVLMTVYYWAVYHPTLVPSPLAFALGLATDLLTGVPLGLHAFAMVAVQWSVRAQRRFLMGQPFLVVWLGFLLACVAAFGLEWGLFSLTEWRLAPLPPVLASLVASVLSYPVAILPLILVHRLLPVENLPRP